MPILLRLGLASVCAVSFRTRDLLRRVCCPLVLELYLIPVFSVLFRKHLLKSCEISNSCKFCKKIIRNENFLNVWNCADISLTCTRYRLVTSCLPHWLHTNFPSVWTTTCSLNWFSYLHWRKTSVYRKFYISFKDFNPGDADLNLLSQCGHL